MDMGRGGFQKSTEPRGGWRSSRGSSGVPETPCFAAAVLGRDASCGAGYTAPGDCVNSRAIKVTGSEGEGVPQLEKEMTEGHLVTCWRFCKTERAHSRLSLGAEAQAP